MEAPSDAISAAPPAHEISTSQVRELLEAVKRSPASLVRQVGNLFRLFVSVLEAKLPSASAPPAASKEGRAAATTARSNSIVTKEEVEVARKIVSSARERRARGRGPVDDRKTEKVAVEGVPKDKVKTLRSWAMRYNRRVPRLMDLLAATPEIAVDDASLVQHHAKQIASREAGKAAASALEYITRVSGDALAKARGKTSATNGFDAERWEAHVLERSLHDGSNAEHRPRKDVIPAAVAAEKACTPAVRAQAFVQGARISTDCGTTDPATLQLGPRAERHLHMFTPHERPRAARESAAEEPSAATETVLPTRKLPSLSQLRVLLNALMHSPVGAIQQVGFLLVLFVSVVEASLPTIDATAAASIADRPVATIADSSIDVTVEDSERATKIVAAAKARRARSSRRTGEGGKSPENNVPNVKMETLRRWAARRNQKAKQLLRLLQATPDISIEDALLVRYHAEGIERREAGKALSAAAATLSYITRVAGDTISKARSGTVAMEGVVAEIHRTTPVQELDDSSTTAARETIPVDAATARICTAVARVQALARGVVARRSFRSEKGLESANMCCTSPVVTCYTMADESPLNGTSKFADGSLVKPDSTVSGYTNSLFFSGTGVSSEGGNNSLGNSPTNTSKDIFTQQTNTTSAIDAAVTLSFGKNRVIKASGPPPILQQAMVTFDEAVVWPTASSVKADEAPVAGAEDLQYGGGQIIGYNGQVISSKTHCVPSFSLSQTPSPRREGTTSPSETPTSPPDKTSSSTPPLSPSPRRRRRREGGRTSPGRLRSRVSSLSVLRVSTATRRPQKPLSTPLFPPDRLQTTDPMGISCFISPTVESTAETEDPKQAGPILSVADSAKKEQGSSQAEVETPASDLLVRCLPATSVGSSSHDTAVRPTMRWGLEGTYQPRRRPALSRTGGPPSLPVARFRPTVCTKSKLLREQIVPESDDDSDDDSDTSPTVGTAVHLHGKSVDGWRKDGDELLETGIFPPARFLQFRTCPRYWCYQDYVLNDQEMKMCARIPAVLVGGGAGVLIADIVEEHGRPAVEIAIERSVRSAFNGGSRDTQWFSKSSEELQAEQDSLTFSIASATAAGAGQVKTTKVENTPSATVGARGSGAFSNDRSLDGASELAVQWRTSLKEQERVLEQCQARYCSAPSSASGTRGAVGIPATDGVCAPLTASETNTEMGDSGLAALYGTSLKEQEQILALSRL
eukprot:jgi/Undpi1/10137/HiC_scaffold_28.g12591.m1